MPERDIGVRIKARTSGDQELQKAARELRDLRQEMTQFGALRVEAMEKFPDSLERQNRYIREQLNLLRQMETVGHRERTARLRDQMRESVTLRQRSDIQRQISREAMEHARAASEFTEAQAARAEWARQQGIGQWGEQRGVDLSTMLMQAGIRGGPGAMAGAGLGAAGRAVAGRMAGMGLAGKLAVGGVGGLGLFAAGKALQWTGQGYGIAKEFETSIFGLRTGFSSVTGDVERLRESVRGLSLDIAMSGREVVELARQWSRLEGRGGLGIEGFGAVLKEARFRGIPLPAAIQFVGQMTRFGTYQMPSQMNEALLTRARAMAEARGMPGFRIQEFLEQVLNITGTVAGTAAIARLSGTDNLLDFLGQTIGLGEPFRGQRGAAFLSRLHGGLTRQTPFGFLATRRLLEQQGRPATLFNIRAQQLKGLGDIGNLRSRWGFMKGLYGGDTGTAALALARELGMEDQLLMFYNPDEGINSIIEMLETGKTPTGKALRQGSTFKDIMAEWKKGQLTPRNLMAAYQESAKAGGTQTSIAQRMASQLGVQLEDIKKMRSYIEAPGIMEMISTGRLTTAGIQTYQSALREERLKESLGFKAQLMDVAAEWKKLDFGATIFKEAVETIAPLLEKWAKKEFGKESKEDEEVGYTKNVPSLIKWK